MKLRSLALLLGLAASASIARAQVGIYVAPTAANLSLPSADTGTFAFLGEGNTSRWFKGAAFGLYYDRPTSPNLAFGADIRGRVIGSTSGSRASSFLVGLRVVYIAHAKLHPYVEPYVGVTATHTGTNPYTLKRADYGVLVGGDYRLNKHLDWRAVELGFGSFTAVSSQTFGTTSNPPNVRYITADSGIVLHF